MNQILIMLVILQEIPTTSVRAILGWLVGILLAFIGVILIHLRSENKERKDSDKDRIKELTRLYEAELAYNKSQDNANIKLITDTGNVLTQSVKFLENNTNVLNDAKKILDDAKSLLDANTQRLKEIQNHVKKNN